MRAAFFSFLFGVTAAGCQLVFQLRDPCSRTDATDAADNSASCDDPHDAAIDATPIDAVPTDAMSVDTSNDAPSDACATHQECAAMQSGTCCVDPGPMGHCAPGTIIATVCVPQ